MGGYTGGGWVGGRVGFIGMAQIKKREQYTLQWYYPLFLKRDYIMNKYIYICE